MRPRCAYPQPLLQNHREAGSGPGLWRAGNGYDTHMGAHVLEMVLMLLAFIAVVIGAAYVFALTAEREPRETSRPRSSAHR